MNHLQRGGMCITYNSTLFIMVLAYQPSDESFSLIPESTYKACIWIRCGYIFKIHKISYICTDSSRSIFWIQIIFRLLIHWLFYIGMPTALMHGASQSSAWIQICSLRTHRCKRSCGVRLSLSCISGFLVHHHAI
jgi:hypothetical protein